jgi:hypothetical protein
MMMMNGHIYLDVEKREERGYRSPGKQAARHSNNLDVPYKLIKHHRYFSIYNGLTEI